MTHKPHCALATLVVPMALCAFWANIVRYALGTDFVATF
jgi:hypothetical protein